MVSVFALQSEEWAGAYLIFFYFYFLFIYLFVLRVHFISHTSVLCLLSVQYRTFLFVCIAV